MIEYLVEHIWRTLGVACVALLLLGFVGCSSCVYCGVYKGYAEGERTGKVIKFSEKGLIWKSGEGELLVNNFAVQGGRSTGGSNLWDFSCRDKSLYSKLQDACASEKQVLLKYKEWLHGPIKIETDYEITDVQVLPS